MKPPFAYVGGKTKLAPTIASLLPAHEHYVEPFAGSLAVLLAKGRSPAETVNDLDGDLMHFWRILRDRPDELARVCALTPHSRAEFDAAARGATDELERARRIFVRLTQGRAHTTQTEHRGWWNRQAPPSPSHQVLAYSARITDVARRLAAVTLESRPAVDVIRDYGTEPTVCMYVDPPYVGSTRAVNYVKEMRDDDDHRTLAAALHDTRAAVVLSGYASPLYDDELYPDWHRTELRGAVTLGHANDRVEVLWSNHYLGDPDLFSLLTDTDTP